VAVDWQRIREQFPVLQHWTYLNSASFGPLPRCAAEAIQNHLRRRDEQAALDFLDWFTEADCVRADAARLIGAGAADIAFIPNAGAALSWLMNGIDWRPGDHILTLAHEFPNNLYWPKVLQEQGVESTEFEPPDGRFSPEEFLAEVRGTTRAVLASAVNYSTGLRLPLEKIGPELKRRGVLLYVDGTQNAGALQTDVRALGVDFLAVHGYKWLLCPEGIGFAYVSPEVREWLKPLVYSWRSHRDWRNVDHLHHGPPELPETAEKYEGGLQNMSGISAMGAVLNLMHQLGPQAIERRVLELAEGAREVLRSCGARLPAGRCPYYDSPVVTAQFPGADASQLAAGLKQRRIAVAARKGSLRVSPHFFNNEEDLQRLGSALGDLLGR